MGSQWKRRRGDLPKCGGSRATSALEVPFEGGSIRQDMRVDQREDRAVGALLGVHAGDCLGATLEFSDWATVKGLYPDGLRNIVGGGPFGWPAGHATDDTDLTRAVVLAYTRPVTGEVVRDAASYMLDWYEGRWPGRVPGSRPDDVGGATAAALQTYQRTRDPFTSGAGAGQAGNGSLMRAIPTAVFGRSAVERISESISISAITHDDRRCTISCAAYNEIAAALIDGASVSDAVGHGVDVALKSGSAGVTAALRAGTSLSLQAAASSGISEVPGTGYVLDSLTLAVSALSDQRGLEAALIDIVRLGYDTDTNAAIAGGLLGACYGAAAIPHRWLELLQFGDEFRQAVRRRT